MTTPVQPVHPALQGLDDCGGCERDARATPVRVENAPGRPEIAYRAGTHAAFKRSMVAGLWELPSGHPLSPVRTLDERDYTIALLDAWASALDVLTFHQERSAQEQYLRTATERTSIQALAQLIGYELGAGVSAVADLAFTLDDSATAPPAVRLEPGLQVQSVPRQNELPAVFETVEAALLQPEWNAISPRRGHPQLLAADTGRLLVRGVPPVKLGDAVVLRVANSPHVMRVKFIHTDAKRELTTIDIADTPKVSVPQLTLWPGIFQRYPQFLHTAGVRNVLMEKSWSAPVLHTMFRVQSWPVQTVARHLIAERLFDVTRIIPTPPDPQADAALIFRARAGVFGHNAPRYSDLPPSGRPATSWSEPGNLEGTTLYLDSVVPGIAVGSSVLLICANTPKVLRVKAVSEVSKAEFSMSAKVTQLDLEGGDLTGLTRRGTSVFLQSEELPLAEVPIKEPVKGGEVMLDGLYLGLEVGRRVIVRGERDDLPGVIAAEARTLSDVRVEDGYTVLHFKDELAYEYRRQDAREPVKVLANVVRATHGESVIEVLGSGDARVAGQRFTLRSAPLAHLHAAGGGTRSTLRVWVDGVRWEEVPTLFGRGPKERVYSTHTDDAGITHVMFGDGVTGARLPSGQENVRASYRRGTGRSGLVPASALTLLTHKPLGVRSVDNPLPAADAGDPETQETARERAPLTVRTLERVVSLSDYEDLAATYPGVGKASATWSWLADRRGVFLTLAGVGGAAVARGSVLYDGLYAELKASGDPYVPLAMDSYQPAFFQLAARVMVASDREPAEVLGRVEAALRALFGFEARSFGQPVTRAQVLAAVQAISGVVAVDLDALHRVGDPRSNELVLRAAQPSPSDPQQRAAELLLLDPQPLDLQVWT